MVESVLRFEAQFELQIFMAGGETEFLQDRQVCGEEEGTAHAPTARGAFPNVYGAGAWKTSGFAK